MWRSDNLSAATHELALGGRGLTARYREVVDHYGVRVQVFPTEKFKIEGSSLPFVVVAAPDGTQLAARTGYGSAKEFEDLIRDAQKAAKKLEDGKAAKK